VPPQVPSDRSFSLGGHDQEADFGVGHARAEALDGLHFPNARRAPRRPQVDEEYVPAKDFKLDGVSVERTDRPSVVRVPVDREAVFGPVLGDGACVSQREEHGQGDDRRRRAQRLTPHRSPSMA